MGLVISVCAISPGARFTLRDSIGTIGISIIVGIGWATNFSSGRNRSGGCDIEPDGPLSAVAGRLGRSGGIWMVLRDSIFPFWQLLIGLTDSALLGGWHCSSGSPSLILAAPG